MGSLYSSLTAARAYSEWNQQTVLHGQFVFQSNCRTRLFGMESADRPAWAVCIPLSCRSVVTSHRLTRPVAEFGGGVGPFHRLTRPVAEFSGEVGCRVVASHR